MAAKKKYGRFILFYFGFLAVLCHVNCECSIKEKPNIIIITADVLGFEDFMYYKHHLKHISKLSEDSLNFTRVYSHLYPTSSRTALLTACLPVRTGLLRGRFLPFTSFPSLASSGGLSQNYPTIAKILDIQEYTRTKFIGVWDLGYGKNGKYLPLNHGFESWFGVLASPNTRCNKNITTIQFTIDIYNEVAILLCFLLTLLMGIVSLWYFRYSKVKYIVYFIIMTSIIYATNNSNYGVSFIKLRSCVLMKNKSILAQPYNAQILTKWFTQDARSFIKTRSPTKPFFLMVNHHGLSEPYFHSPRFSQNDTILSALLELDWSIGQIMDMLDSDGINNTLFIFTALSGINHRRRSLKVDQDTLDLWERNLIVPLFIKWDKRWHSNITVNQTVALIDIMPTILNLTCQSSKNHDQFDGKPLPLSSPYTEEPLDKYFFHYHDVTGPTAVTHHKYKAFFSTKKDGVQLDHDPPLLYDINIDPDETTPLPTDEYQDVITNLTNAVEKHIENRTKKWLSQFEHPILPWLFPCADFPYCYKTINHDMELDNILESL